jgi:hypothetical protein
MKSYICLLLFALALSSVPSANAGQAPDPELAIAHDTFADAFTCVPPPYVSVECLTFSGGMVVTKFTKLFGGQIIAQAIQAGSSPREWRVDANSCLLAENGDFTSTSQGFHPWKRELLDVCKACVDDATCLSLLP